VVVSLWLPRFFLLHSENAEHSTCFVETLSLTPRFNAVGDHATERKNRFKRFFRLPPPVASR